MPPAREFIYFVQDSGKFLEHCALMGCTMWAKGIDCNLRQNKKE